MGTYVFDVRIDVSFFDKSENRAKTETLTVSLSEAEKLFRRGEEEIMSRLGYEIKNIENFSYKRKVRSTDEFEIIIRDIIGIDGFGWKILENMDLSDVDFSKGNWNLDGWSIHNVAFSHINEDTAEKKIISGLSFKGAWLDNVSFVQTKLINCNFDTMYSEREPHGILSESIMYQVNFYKSELDSCRFRGTKVKFADFRYSHITDCSMSEGKFETCDFYFCRFIGATNFIDSNFTRCLLSKSTVFENNCIRIQNIPEGIMQEDYKTYDNYPFVNATHKKNSEIETRYESAEFYKYISGIYAGKGLYHDSNEAYKKSKINYTIHYWLKSKTGIRDAIKNLWGLFANISTMILGYGYMLKAPILWYIFFTFVFGLIYYCVLDKICFLKALVISFSNSISPAKELECLYWPSIQTLITIIIVGYFGFILANKVRNNS